MYLILAFNNSLFPTFPMLTIDEYSGDHLHCLHYALRLLEL